MDTTTPAPVELVESNAAFSEQAPVADPEAEVHSTNPEGWQQQ
jgi:hypothetical protein